MQVISIVVLFRERERMVWIGQRRREIDHRIERAAGLDPTVEAHPYVSPAAEA
jgi:hypothetical protein